MVGQKVRALMLYFFALVQELIDRPSYINEQLLEHDAYISCLQLKKVNMRTMTCITIIFIITPHIITCYNRL